MRPMTCDTELATRSTRRDLWCRTHGMWVYAGEETEVLNDKHEKVRYVDS